MLTVTYGPVGPDTEEVTDLSSSQLLRHTLSDSKVYGANMGPIWGRKDPGGPHVGPMNFAIWAVYVVNKVIGFICAN